MNKIWNKLVNKVKRVFEIVKFEFMYAMLDLRYKHIPLRWLLFKERLPGLLKWIVGFFIVYTHMQYVFYDFANKEALEQPDVYFGILGDYHRPWFVQATSQAFLWLKAIFVLYLFYFILSTFSLALYANTVKLRDDVYNSAVLTMMCGNYWFSEAYMFYICQENVWILMILIYNGWYWVFHLIMWDEELEQYYDDQASLAYEERENFIHDEDRNITDNHLHNPSKPPSDQPLPAIGVIDDAWLATYFKSPYINLDTLQVTAEYKESNPVENLLDIEERYNLHLKTFYGAELDEPETNDLEELNTMDAFGEDEFWPHIEPVMDMLAFFKFFVLHVWLWVDVRNDRMYYYALDHLEAFMTFYRFIKGGKYRVPKVVGPYAVYHPSNKIRYARYGVHPVFGHLRVLFPKIVSFFSLIQRYQNVKWFFFKVKFWFKRKKLVRKRKKINYIFFKNQIK